MEEIWKDIKGFDGYYQISSNARVKSVERVIVYKSGKKKRINERIMSCCKNNTGYILVQLFKDGVAKNVFVHQLMADAFIPNPHNKPCIDHINTDKTDNRIKNLRWCTYKENKQNVITREKEKLWYNKMSIPIIMIDKENNIICAFSSAIEASKTIGICRTAIVNALSKKAQIKLGYYFKYIA